MDSFIMGRSEWCISRQRAWGVPIPALHNEATGDAILDDKSLQYIVDVLDKKGVSHWFDGPVEDFVAPYLQATGHKFTKGSDTIDVWFDSGTSWTMVRDLWNDMPNEAQTDYLADVCLEGSDQHRGWFQSLLLTAVASDTTKGRMPYKHLITHGFVLDGEGKKMSKSLGNVISPVTIINGGKVCPLGNRV